MSSLTGELGKKGEDSARWDVGPGVVVVQADWNVGEAWFRVGGRRVKSKVGALEAL